MSARLLIVALDGADEAMVDAGSADGSLPNLAALRARGAAGPMSAPPAVTDDGLWASFHYGQTLGEHGRPHYLKRLRNGRWRMAYEEEGERRTFWQRLSDEGLRVAVLDAPKCASPQPMNGLHLADWLVHGRYSDTPSSYPPGLAAQITGRFGATPPSQCGKDVGAMDPEGRARFVSNLAMTVDMKRKAALDRLEAEDWHLFIVAFKEAHCAGHGLWDRAGAPDDPVKAILVRIDAAVGDLVAAAGPKAEVAVFATTRMLANASLENLQVELVRRLNARFGETWIKQKSRGAWRKLTGTQIPPPIEAWPHNENCLSLKLRRPARTRSAVEQALAGARDAETGRSIVLSMHRPSEQEVGARRNALSDVLVEFAPGVRPRAIEVPGLGRIEAELPVMRPGNHAAGGHVIATVDGVARMEDFAGFAASVLRREA